MTEFADLAADEHELVGAWLETLEGTRPDDVDQRILWLVSRRLVARGSDEGGWRQLFIDPLDGRLWELTFPRGSLFGGGPRRLAELTPREAAARYDAKE